MSERRHDKWFGRIINHDGDGPPGPERTMLYVTPISDHADAAEAFACERVDRECREDRICEEGYGQFDGVRYVIETRPEGATEWQRFRVRVSVKLEYKAEVTT